MSWRRKILTWVYPFFRVINLLSRKGAAVLYNSNETPPPVSFYSLSVVRNNGEMLHLEAYKGKKVLLVNTASDCGFTPQYAGLQKLYSDHSKHLQVIAFPANDFKQQEKSTDEEIATFCQVHYGVSFPVAKKCSVIRGDHQHEVYQWLTDKKKNGWNDRSPSWNFSKYLVNEKGWLMNYFGPSVSPTGKEVQAAINK